MVEVTENPIDLMRVLECVAHEECGAQVLFVGTTRRWTAASKLVDNLVPRPDSTIAWPSDSDPATSDPVTSARIETQRLHYEAYRELALQQMHDLEAQARQRWSLQEVVLVHRLGDVLPKEASVAVAVSCPHRSEAFEAAKWLIDTLKHDVPIWKQEHYVQHGSQWIHPTSGSCNCDHTPTNHSPAAADSSPAAADSHAELAADSHAELAADSHAELAEHQVD